MERSPRDPRIAALPDIHGHAKGEHKPFAEERPIPYTARMLFLWFFHACRRSSPRFIMVSDHMNYLTFEDPAAVNLVRRALKLAQAGDLYGAAETAGVELGHAAVVSEGLRKGMRYSIGAEVDNDPRCRPDAQNIVDAMKPDGMVRSVHFIPITHPQHGEHWLWAFDNPEFKALYDVVGIATVWETYMATLLDAIEKLPGNIIGHFYVPAKFGHWPDDAALETYEDRFVEACAARGMAIELNSRYFYKFFADDDAALEKYRTVHLRLLRKAKAKGVMIAVGSDAHSPKDQGGAFEAVLALLDEADINEIAFPINGRLARVALRATEEIMRQHSAALTPPAPERAALPRSGGEPVPADGERQTVSEDVEVAVSAASVSAVTVAAMSAPRAAGEVTRERPKRSRAARAAAETTATEPNAGVLAEPKPLRPKRSHKKRVFEGSATPAETQLAAEPAPAAEQAPATESAQGTDTGRALDAMEDAGTAPAARPKPSKTAPRRRDALTPDALDLDAAKPVAAKPSGAKPLAKKHAVTKHDGEPPVSAKVASAKLPTPKTPAGKSAAPKLSAPAKTVAAKTVAAKPLAAKTAQGKTSSVKLAGGKAAGTRAAAGKSSTTASAKAPVSRASAATAAARTSSKTATAAKKPAKKAQPKKDAKAGSSRAGKAAKKTTAARVPARSPKHTVSAKTKKTSGAKKNVAKKSVTKKKSSRR